MPAVILSTAFTWCLMIGTSIICNYGRPSEITKILAAGAVVCLGLMASIWAIAWGVTTLVA